MIETEFSLNKVFYFIFYLNAPLSNFYATTLINEDRYAKGILSAWAHAKNMHIFKTIFSLSMLIAFKLMKKECIGGGCLFDDRYIKLLCYPNA